VTAGRVTADEVDVVAFVARTCDTSSVPRRLQDRAAAEQIADVLRPDAHDTNTNNGAEPKPDAAATRSTTTRPDQEWKVRRA